MIPNRLAAIPCKISRGVVSTERAFEVARIDGSTHDSFAPVFYFWNDKGEPLEENEPAGSDETIAGSIAARVIERHNGAAMVSIPDGCLVEVKSDSVTKRPGEVIVNVPVGPRS
jgi:hypothetical protein